MLEFYRYVIIIDKVPHIVQNIYLSVMYSQYCTVLGDLIDSDYNSISTYILNVLTPTVLSESQESVFLVSASANFSPGSQSLTLHDSF